MGSIVTVRIEAEENSIVDSSEFVLERRVELSDGNPRFTARLFEEAATKAVESISAEVAGLRGDVRAPTPKPSLDLEKAWELFKNLDSGPTVTASVNRDWLNWVSVYGEALVKAAMENSAE